MCREVRAEKTLEMRVKNMLEGSYLLKIRADYEYE